MFANREIRPREVDFEFMWLWLLPLFAVSAWITSVFQTLIGYECPLKSIVGLPCMLCGGTRAAYALGHGNLGEALIMNPLATLGMTGALGYFAYAALCVLRRRQRRIRFVGLGGLSTTGRRFVRLFVAVILMANWGYLIAVGR